MREIWDVIVIGAGIGGLTAAAYLVKEGLRVLILERSPHIGGTAYVYHRKGFTFPMGPLGFSHPETIEKIFNELGIGQDLKFLRVHYHLCAFGLDLPISLPFDQMVNKLSNLFPTDTEGVNQFFKDMDDLVSNRENPYLVQSLSASEYLQKLIKDWRLRRLLGSIGTREPYSGLPLLSAMWNLMGNIGIWFPEEGMESFCERLRKVIIQSSGSRGLIQLNKAVSKIRVDQGKVLGVTLDDGTEIDSSFIISNADYKSTFLRLLDPKAVPPYWYHAISRARLTHSIFQVCLGVDREKIDLSAFKEARRLIYKKEDKTCLESDLDWNLPKIDPQVLATQEIEISFWGKDWESKERPSMVLRVEADYQHFSKFRLGWRKRSTEYLEYKTQLAQALVQEVSHLFPGLEKSVLVMDIATPLTFEDQGGRTSGAVAGWSWSYEDFKDNQPKELILTPIKGLYMTGHQAFSALFMGGIPTALESGRRATYALLHGAGPTDEISIPEGKSDAEKKMGEGVRS